MAELSIYGPLVRDRKEVRLLRLQGSQAVDSTLVCSLETVTLKTKPIYEAISYCWGEVPGTETTRLNGIDFEAPASAAKVLRRFRPCDGSRTLWIDALCINQADIEERNSQVSIMDQIYASTEKCLVWLGDQNENTESILHCLHTISAEYYEQVYHATNGFLDEVPEEFQYRRDPKSFLFEACTAQEVSDFFCKPYFSRVWVQQEAILPPKATCVCGGYEIDWYDVCRASKWLMTELPYVDPNVEYRANNQGLEMAWVFAESTTVQKKGVVTSALLQSNRYLMATDVRDKCYAVLGLIQKPEVTDGFMDWFFVDYNLQPAKVFRYATLMSFCREGSLKILDYVEQVPFEIRAHEADLPSWTIRLDRGFEADLLFAFGDDHDCAPQPLDLELIRARVDSDCILLEGFKMCHVSELIVHEPIRADNDALTGLGSILHAGLSALSDLNRRDCGIELLDCITTGRQMDFLRSLNPTECEHIISMLTDLCAANANEEEGIMVDSSTDEKLIDSLPVFHSIAKKVCMNRKLFTTSCGHLGIGHPSMQEKDCVAALFGGRHLCLLRPIAPLSKSDGPSSQRQRYQFVGLAYVPSLMDGTQVEARVHAGQEPQIFEIR